MILVKSKTSFYIAPVLRGLLILIFTGTFFSSELYSQSSEGKKDSLENVIATSDISDSLKSDAYLQLFANHCYSTDDACDYLSQAISIATESSNDLLLHTYKKAGDTHKENSNTNIAISFYNQGLRAIKDTTNHHIYSNFYDQLGYCYYELKNVELMQHFFDASINSANLANLGDYGLGWKYNSYGELFFSIEEYSTAISFWEKGAESFKRHLSYNRDGSYYGMNNSYINIAMTYSRLQLWDFSSSYMTKCVAIQDSIDDTYSKSWTRYVLASFYEKMGDIDKSIASLTESLENTNKFLSESTLTEKDDLYKELHRIKFTVLTTLAGNYGDQEDFVNADSIMKLVKDTYMKTDIMFVESYRYYETQVRLDFMKGDTLKAIETCKSIIENNENIDNYFFANHYASYLLKNNNYSEVIVVLAPFLENENSDQTNYTLQSAYILLSEAYAGIGKYKEAYELEEKFNNIRDSIRSDERSVSMVKTAIKFDYSNQMIEDSLLLENEKMLHTENLKAEQEKTKAQEKLNFILVIGLGLVLILGLWAVRNAFLNKKANKLIQKQKEQVEVQKMLVDDKNKEIIDSINYAKRIQNALLKSDDIIENIIPEHFIFYKPKDIVSGDFYWTLEKQGYLYIAVADCTGHGVPGGFMSMLGISFLNEINAPKEILSPAEILNKLREKIIKELNQEDEVDASKDGMDISLIRLKKEENKIGVCWAGANNSLYISKNKTIEETKGNRQPIGIHAHMTDFTNHKISVSKGDNIYLFSDGYPDQFGGPSRKKFKYSQFKNLLTSIADAPVENQKSALYENFTAWKGDLEQTDDVCLFGIKV